MPENDDRSVVWSEFLFVRKESSSLFPRISKVAEQLGDDSLALFTEFRGHSVRYRLCFPLPVPEPKAFELKL